MPLFWLSKLFVNRCDIGNTSLCGPISQRNKKDGLGPSQNLILVIVFYLRQDLVDSYGSLCMNSVKVYIAHWIFSVHPKAQLRTYTRMRYSTPNPLAEMHREKTFWPQWLKWLIVYILICSIHNGMIRGKCDVLEILPCPIYEFQYIKGFQEFPKYFHVTYLIIALFRLRSKFFFNSASYPRNLLNPSRFLSIHSYLANFWLCNNFRLHIDL